MILFDLDELIEQDILSPNFANWWGKLIRNKNPKKEILSLICVCASIQKQMYSQIILLHETLWCVKNIYLKKLHQ